MSSQIQITGETKVKSLTGVLVGTSGVVSSLNIDGSLGIPQLDVNGKILVSQLPNSVMEYKGVWNAATNTPTLANGTGNQGDVYLCNVAGTVNFGAGAIAFFVGDQVIYSGSIWQRASGATGTVTSVAVTETGDSLNITGSPITTSGTINIGFNGTNLQYVNGAGNLTTFPILTGYVPYTGATQDVDLGAFSLNGKSLHIKGTAGNGHLGLKHQSAAATGSANESLIYADSLGDLSWQNANLYLSKFITSANTANRSYTFPNANGTVALTSDLANYVDLTTAQTIGGTKTFSDATKNNGGIFLQNASSNSLAGYMNIGGLTNGVKFTSGGGVSNSFTLPSATGYTFTFPNATGTIALTSDLTGYITAVTATSPLSSSGGTTPNITIAQATTSANGYLSSTDWNTFNNKQATITLTTTGTSGAATLIGATLNIPNYAPDLSGYVTLAGSQTITGAKTFSTYSKFDGGVILKNNVSASLAGYVGLSAYSASGNKGINIDFDTYSNSFYFSGTLSYQYTFPAASGTIALVGGSGVGTVTSVAALTIGTSGTDLSSSVANSTTTPVITLNVPTASAANRGALSSADWTTFNSKQGTITLTTTGTSGAATFSSNTLNIPNYTITNAVTGTGTTNYLPKFTSASTIGDSQIFDNGTFVGIGRTTNASAGWNLAVQNGLTVTQGTTETQLFGYFGDAGVGTYSNHNFKIRVNNTDRAIFDTSGNLGLGVTPSAWNASGKVIQIGDNGTFALENYSGIALNITQNGYRPSGITNHYYTTSAAASNYYQYNGVHAWQTAPSGTAGAAITFTQAMTLTASGRLLINKTNEETYQLDVNGTGRFSGDLSIAYTTANLRLFLNNTTATTGRSWYFNSFSNGNLYVGNTTASDIFNFSSTGAATFSSSVQADGGLITSYSSSSNAFVDINGSTSGVLAGIRLYSSGSTKWIISHSLPSTYRFSIGTATSLTTFTERFGIDHSTGAATFEGQVGVKNANTAGYNFGVGSSSGNGMMVYNGSTGNSYVFNVLNDTTNGSIVSLYGSDRTTAKIVLKGDGTGVFNSTITATGFFESSDSRLKTLIQDNYQTKGIASITPKLYTKNGKVELGYYAQDFVGVLDSAVSKGSDDMLCLSYREVHTAKIYALEQEIKELKAKLN